MRSGKRGSNARRGVLGTRVALVLGGLAMAATVTAPAAHAGFYGSVSTTAYFLSYKNAVNYISSTQAGAQKQALALCKQNNSPSSSYAAPRGGSITAGVNGYYATHEWECQ